MTSWIVLMATATLGVDQGWQPIAGGGYEYIIQIEPETLDSIRSGRDLFLHLPESMVGVQSYRITSGSGPLPHNGEPPPAIAQAARTEVPGGPRLGGAPNPMPKGPDLRKGADMGKGAVADEKATPETMTPEPGSRPLPVQPTGNRQAEGNQQATGNQQASGESASPVAAMADATKTPRTAVPNEPPQDGGSPSDDLPKGFDAAGRAETKPVWMSLNAALMVLFASLGVNMFLGWVTVAQRGRYRSVLARLAVR
jgi:hypothetical protein